MSDLSFKAFFTYYATHLIEMLSNFRITMNCIFAFIWPSLCSQFFHDALQLSICHAHL